MTPNEVFMLSALGIPVGAFLLVLLSGEKRNGLRKATTKWCLVVGGISTALVVIALVADLDLAPSRGTLGMAFIGLPALPAGLLLRFFPHGLRRVQ
jgi:hypothetical protein